MRGWPLPAGQDGADFVHPDLIRAAAEEPVIEDANGQPAFDPESFRNRVLLLTGTAAKHETARRVSWSPQPSRPRDCVKPETGPDLAPHTGVVLFGGPLASQDLDCCVAEFVYAAAKLHARYSLPQKGHP